VNYEFAEGKCASDNWLPPFYSDDRLWPCAGVKKLGIRSPAGVGIGSRQFFSHSTNETVDLIYFFFMFFNPFLFFGFLFIHISLAAFSFRRNFWLN
jgi:hypothetical protein